MQSYNAYHENRAAGLQQLYFAQPTTSWLAKTVHIYFDLNNFQYAICAVALSLCLCAVTHRAVMICWSHSGHFAEKHTHTARHTNCARAAQFQQPTTTTTMFHSHFIRAIGAKPRHLREVAVLPRASFKIISARCVHIPQCNQIDRKTSRTHI